MEEKEKARKRVNDLMQQAAGIVNRVAAVQEPVTGDQLVAAYIELRSTLLSLNLLAVRDSEFIEEYVLASSWMCNIRDRQPVKWQPARGTRRKGTA